MFHNPLLFKKVQLNFVLKKHKKKHTKNRIGIYSSILGYINIKKQSVPKTCNYDMKLNKYNNDFYLCVTYNKPIDRSVPKYKSCALDPGARTMHVLYYYLQKNAPASIKWHNLFLVEPMMSRHG